jgi:hypothetical protein
MMREKKKIKSHRMMKMLSCKSKKKLKKNKNKKILLADAHLKHMMYKNHHQVL